MELLWHIFLHVIERKSIIHPFYMTIYNIMNLVSIDVNLLYQKRMFGKHLHICYHISHTSFINKNLITWVFVYSDQMWVQKYFPVICQCDQISTCPAANQTINLNGRQWNSWKFNCHIWWQECTYDTASAFIHTTINQICCQL